MMEIAIPWKALGIAGPNVEQAMRVNVEISDRRSNELRKEAIPDTQSNQSWTWPEFRLVPSGTGGIDEVAGDPQSRIVADGMEIKVEGEEDVRTIEVYTPSGAVAARCEGRAVTLHEPGIYVVRAVLGSGHMLHRKIALR